jgi:predicted kinase
MSQLLLLRGISGSGKSTHALELTKNNNFYRVNRDEIRLLISAQRWSRQKEKMVIAVEKSMAEAILKKGQSVIIDDTNLLRSHETLWQEVVDRLNKDITDEKAKIKFEIKKIDTPLDLCIARDKLRKGSKYISQAVIEHQAIKSGMYNLDTAEDSIVLCDIDGTIANGDHRVKILDDKTNRNRWKDYFNLCDKDEPITSVINVLKEYKSQGKQIVLVSGRAADLTADKTITWLEEHKVPYDRLLMRLGGDGRPDTEVKKEILNEILLHHPKSAILCVIDDRFSVVEQWKALGLKVRPVYKGEFIEEFFSEHKDSCKDKESPIKGRCDSCGAIEAF